MIFLKKNIEIIDQIGNKKSSAFAKINLGSIYSSISDFSSSARYYLKAYQELADLKTLDDRRVAVLAGNLAKVYYELEKRDSSIHWAKRAMQLGKQTNNVTAQFFGNYLMGVNLSRTQVDSSLVYLEQAYHFAKQSGRPSYLGMYYIIKGIVLGEMKRYVEAEENLLNGVELLKEQPEDEDYISAIYNLGLIANKSGNYAVSSHYLKEYVLISDSLNVAKNQELIHEFQTKYETKQKENRLAAQELKIQKQQSNLFLAILGGSLLASILGGIYLYNRKSHSLKLKQLQQEKENAILNAFIRGEERERNRISHDLHDGVAAMIGAAKMTLESIPHLSEDKQMEQLSKVKSILENTHADVRHIAHNLLPTVLEKEGLIKATEQFASEVNETGLVRILVKDKGSNAHEISSQFQLMLFRIIQELVNNIIKHSQAQNAMITFGRNKKGLMIEVVDDGIGYNGDINTGNQGLYGISQRLKSIGGDFKIISKREKGTQAMVEVQVP